jgi:hypothetical protein
MIPISGHGTSRQAKYAGVTEWAAEALNRAQLFTVIKPFFWQMIRMLIVLNKYFLYERYN